MFQLRSLRPPIRKLTTTSTLQKKNHYDALGISAKATQADVKSAYYKLSMQYHPDKNKDTTIATTEKFRDITEAYEILGNVKSRKLYDRGLYFGGGATAAPDDAASKYHKPRTARPQPPTSYHRTTVYDFDEWSRAHYGATLNKNMQFKRQQQFDKMKEKKLAEAAKIERVLCTVALLALGCAYIFRTDHDQVNNSDGSSAIKPSH